MKRRDEWVVRVLRLAGLIQVELSEEQAAQLLDHVRWVIRANTRVNLTALTDLPEALRLHVIDSLAAVHEINSAPEGPIIDVGTGGGFPGIPLGIVTGRDVALLDSSQKKAAVLREYVGETAKESIMVVGERAEQHALERASCYAAVVARAVAALPSLAELASPLLARTGLLIAMKGQVSEDELDRGRRAALLVGLKERGVRRYRLPEGGEERAIVTYEKVDDPEVALPRRPGRAQKRPLT